MLHYAFNVWIMLFMSTNLIPSPFFSRTNCVAYTQGFNSALTEPVGDQIKEMELKLHPELNEPLTALCNDSKTTVVVLSGSNRSVMDEVYMLGFVSFFLF